MTTNQEAKKSASQGKSSRAGGPRRDLCKKTHTPKALMELPVCLSIKK